MLVFILVQASIQAGEESSQSKIMDHLSSTQLKEKNNVAPLGQAPGGKGLFRDPIEVLGCYILYSLISP